ncbi:hypothetical protein ACNTMW_23120 [Planosporangium sp. 12N6]|uniref:hypothetical protein n=1 Tax=Planosporangium spinosum TaxID=3402278 RepID=UPI003CF9698B
MKLGRTAQRLVRIGALATLGTAASLAAVTAPAYAESAPGCSSTVQIGSTSYITVGGSTFASVKQFKGCNKNWAYVYVWSSYRSSHSHWEACAAVGNVDNSALEGTKCNYSNPVEVWSSGTNTLSNCTQAIGWIPDGASARTDIRC